MKVEGRLLLNKKNKEEGEKGVREDNGGRYKKNKLYTLKLNILQN